MPPTSSPKLSAIEADYDTAAAIATKNFNISEDYLQAAQRATRNLNVLEDTASKAGLSVEAYMRATGTYPCAEYAVDTNPVRVMDKMEADYLRAALIATSRENARAAQEAAVDAEAIRAGLTVEQAFGPQ